MSWRDRDYSREIDRVEPVTRMTWLSRPAGAVGAVLLVHLAAFALLAVLATEMADARPLSILSLGAGQNHPLAILTHPLSTRRPGTLLLTVLSVWLLGNAAARRVGSRSLLRLYVVGNLLAGVVAFCVGLLWPAGTQVPLESPLGATAAWAFSLWRCLPEHSLRLAGRFWRRWELLLGGAGAAFLLMFALDGIGAASRAAALAAGAAAVPFSERLVRWPGIKLRLRRLVASRSTQPGPAEPDIDPILAKISRFGIGSLTPKERELLEAARRAKLEAARRSGRIG